MSVLDGRRTSVSGAIGRFVIPVPGRMHHRRGKAVKVRRRRREGLALLVAGEVVETCRVGLLLEEGRVPPILDIVAAAAAVMLRSWEEDPRLGVEGIVSTKDLVLVALAVLLVHPHRHGEVAVGVSLFHHNAREYRPRIADGSSSSGSHNRRGCVRATRETTPLVGAAVAHARRGALPTVVLADAPADQTAPVRSNRGSEPVLIDHDLPHDGQRVVGVEILNRSFIYIPLFRHFRNYRGKSSLS